LVEIFKAAQVNDDGSGSGWLTYVEVATLGKLMQIKDIKRLFDKH